MNKQTGLDEAFARFLELAEQLRPGYRASLGTAPENLDFLNGLREAPLPDLAVVIYRNVAGTPRATDNQCMVDLIPGYRLIHYSELPEAIASVKSITGESGLVPILANYSSDFVAVRDGRVYGIMHDESPSLLLEYESELQFLQTHCACYERGVYFLDHNQWVDFSLPGYLQVGAELNPAVPCWKGD